MLQHAQQLADAKIPFIFDPGQGLPMFDGAELKDFVAKATWVAVNDYEAQMLCDRTGHTLESLSRSHLHGVVVTLGAEGCDVWQQGERTHVPGVAAEPSSIRPAAATPSERPCYPVLKRGGGWKIQFNWGTVWEQSRLRVEAGRIMICST